MGHPALLTSVYDRSTMPKRIRRTNAALFLDKLIDFSIDGIKPIGNIKLRAALRWDEAKYNRIRADLIRDEEILPGKGFGGSVRLVKLPTKKSLRVFVSYSHVDELIKTELLKHLEPLRKLGLIDTWHDRQIKAGEDWGKKIDSGIEDADVILLIVSIDFINSNYCYDIELERALARHADGEAVVIPIIARSCMWKIAPFAKLQAVPKDAKPLALWANLDEALSAVAASIRDTVETILNR
jgi:hypothetical protein